MALLYFGDNLFEGQIEPLYRELKLEAASPADLPSIINIKPNVVRLDNNCFQGYTTLVSITLPDSVTSLGDGCFAGCRSLSSITLPDSITSIGTYCFRGCSSLTSITLPKFIFALYNECLQYCSSLTSVTLPDSLISIGNQCFNGCSSLTSITLPDSVTSLGYRIIGDCRSLTSIIIPSSVTSFGTYCLAYCQNMLAVYFKGTPPNLSSSTFYYDKSLASILIPSPASSELLLHLSAQGSTTSSISAANGVKDISGRGNHGQAYNGVTVTTTTDYGDAFGFPNNNSYIDLTAKKDTIFTQGNAYTFSVSFYITEKPTRANGVLVMWVFSVPQIQVWLTSDYKIQIRSDNSFAAYTAPDAIALNTFYNVTVSCNYLEGTRTVYINGQAVATATRTAGALTLNVTYMVLGNHKGSTGYNLPGYITDARIYGKALSPTEVSRLYKSVQWTPKIKSSTYGGASSATWAAVPPSPILALDPLTSATGSNGIKDISGNGYHGTLSGTASIDKTSNSFVFDGATSSKIEVTNSSFLSAINGKSAYSLSITASCTNSSYPRTGGLINNSSTGYLFGFIYITTTSIVFNDRMSSSSESIKQLSIYISNLPAEAFSINGYYTVTATVDYTNGIAVLYVNGVEVSRSTNWFKGTKASVTALRLGQSSANSGYTYSGSVKNVRVYDRVLTPAEVAALHDNSKCSPAAGTQVQIAPTGTAVYYATPHAVVLIPEYSNIKKLVMFDNVNLAFKIYETDGTRKSDTTYTDFSASNRFSGGALSIVEDPDGYIYAVGVDTGWVVKYRLKSTTQNGQITYSMEQVAEIKPGSLVAAGQISYCAARDSMIVVGWRSGGGTSIACQLSRDLSTATVIGQWSSPSIGGCFDQTGTRLYFCIYGSNKFAYMTYSSVSDTALKTSYTSTTVPPNYSSEALSSNDNRYVIAAADGFMYMQMLNGSIFKYSAATESWVGKVGNIGSGASTTRCDYMGTYEYKNHSILYSKHDGGIYRLYL